MHDDDLALALELADLADLITVSRHRADNLVIETKPDRTPVTDADRAVETAVRDRLAEARPDDGVIGEEFGGDGASAREWIVDPIDGTASFMRGMPTWATLIALREAGVVTVGVVSMPALQRRWWARRGGGAFANGEPIHVSGIRELADAQLCWSGIESWDEVGRPDPILALCRAVWRTRGIGDAWQYMLVAEGVAEIALDPEAKIWDFAPMQVIVEEAGGRFTALTGEATIDGGSGIATNGHVHDAALAIVGL